MGDAEFLEAIRLSKCAGKQTDAIVHPGINVQNFERS